MSTRWSGIRVIDAVALLGFGLAWLIPMAWVGYLGGPPASWPVNCQDLYAVSCLFGRGSERVSMFYVQIRLADRPGWYDLPEREYFRLEPFGHRNRFDRFMARFGYRDEDHPARSELAHWIAATHRERHPDDARIIAVRFLWVDHTISAEAPPTDRWRKPPRSQAGRLRTLGEPVIIREAGK
ncbi:hypothetical protein DB30_01098 [Enhygromyxa salina]|uniref:Uncharacterized protein n=1 Tax=Enhygromyxa salina TaxID=215803 RepID=A0A0C2CT14_9BACT|nr:hypothetical protein [Enhygromyxa salina]KIG12740.1 hypothetical protein DB30_01098 [Enhygromyxa salina]